MDEVIRIRLAERHIKRILKALRHCTENMHISYTVETSYLWFKSIANSFRKIALSTDINVLHYLQKENEVIRSMCIDLDLESLEYLETNKELKKFVIETMPKIIACVDMVDDAIKYMEIGGDLPSVESYRPGIDNAITKRRNIF